MVRLPDERTLSFEYLKKLKDTVGFSCEQLFDMVDRAVEIGAAHARSYIGLDIVKEAQKRKAKVEMHKGGLVASRLVRAQYDHSIKTIVVSKMVCRRH